ncbi:hypothetical protein V8C34DRAFT_274299 [Trichoderma compactum]
MYICTFIRAMGVFSFLLYPYFFRVYGVVRLTKLVLLFHYLLFPLYCLYSFLFSSSSLFLESLEWIYHLRKHLLYPQGW